jgi:uncharacterized lipoprotein YajG
LATEFLGFRISVEFRETFYAPTYYSLRMIMNKSLVLAALFAAVALSACGKKEEVVAPAAEAASAVMAPVVEAASAVIAPAMAEAASAMDTAASAAAEAASAVDAAASAMK